MITPVKGLFSIMLTPSPTSPLFPLFLPVKNPNW